MLAKDNKPQIEVPEEVLNDPYVNDDDQEEQPVFTRPKPDSVSEVDWVDQQTDVPLDDDDDYS